MNVLLKDMTVLSSKVESSLSSSDSKLEACLTCLHELKASLQLPIPIAAQKAISISNDDIKLAASELVDQQLRAKNVIFKGLP
jgi:hypothetical protein